MYVDVRDLNYVDSDIAMTTSSDHVELAPDVNVRIPDPPVDITL